VVAIPKNEKPLLRLAHASAHTSMLVLELKVMISEDLYVKQPIVV
jgi:hypothetical protein